MVTCQPHKLETENARVGSTPTSASNILLRLGIKKKNRMVPGNEANFTKTVISKRTHLSCDHRNQNTIQILNPS